jgi:VWFA-related protein
LSSIYIDEELLMATRIISVLIILISSIFLLSFASINLAQEQGKFDLVNLDIKNIDISKYPTISVSVDFTNQNGQKVIPLKTDRFEVYEDEIKFPSNFTWEGEIFTSFLIDASGSMKGRMDEVIQSVSRYVYRMDKKRGDKAAIFSFNNWEEGCQLRQDFTDDEGKLLEAIKEIEPRGETALYDAIRDTSIHFFPEYYSATKIIIILTDGEDNQSSISWFQSVDFAKSKDIKIFCLALGNNADIDNLSKICQSTGGEVFSAQNPEELPIIYSKISTKVVTTKFKITYTTDVLKPKGKPCHVKVIAYRNDAVWCQSTPVAYKMRY